MSTEHIGIVAALVFEAAAIGLTVALVVYAWVKR